jgi:hypothetical protein
MKRHHSQALSNKSSSFCINLLTSFKFHFQRFGATPNHILEPLGGSSLRNMLMIVLYYEEMTHQACKEPKDSREENRPANSTIECVHNGVHNRVNMQKRH